MQRRAVVQMSREITIDEKRDFKGVWIPKRLYLSPKFTPNEKFILIEIYSFSKKGICYAGNRHFANFTGLKENTIQKMLLKFENDGYINRSYTYKNGTKEIEKRTITLLDKFYKEFINEKESDNDCDGMDSNPDVVMEKNQWGGGIKVGDKYSSSKCNSSLSDTVNVFPTEKKKNTNAFSTGVKKSELDLKYVESIAQQFIENEYTENEKQKADEFVGLVSYFCEQYKARLGKPHKFLKPETIEKLVRKYIEPTDLLATMKKDEIIKNYHMMIDKFFDTEYNKQGKFHGEIDKTLCYFWNDSIIENLFYRTCYAELDDYEDDEGD
jgi:hypothetical protein